MHLWIIKVLHFGVKETLWRFSLKCFRRFETINIIMIQGIASLMNESIRVHFSDSAGHAKCIYHLSQPYPEYKDLNFSRNLLASFSEIFFWCLSTLVRLLWPNMNGPYA